MNGIGRERINLNGTELDWKGREQTPLNGLDRIKLDWTGLNWTGVHISGVTGLNWTELDSSSED